MPDIFLSYNREDRPIAQLFAEQLIADGFDVWWDATLRAGEDYDEVTENALNTAGAVIVLWTPRSVQSRWVRAEATVAQRNRSFIPVMVESCVRPVMFELTQSADLIGWDGSAQDARWQALVSDVRAHMERRRDGAAKARAAATSALWSGERRQVSVLSCALVTEAAADEIDPEDWDSAVRLFGRAGGDVLAGFDCSITTSGATMTAVFGLGHIAEDDALRAVRASRALIAAIDQIMLPGGALAQVRCGVDCGPVVIGATGTPPSGPALDGAAQLQHQAAAGTVLISGGVATVAGGFLELERVSPRSFRVMGEAESHSRFDLSRARGLTRFVGRGDDFAILDTALSRSAAGEGQVVGIMAEAGSGKSRLCYEFTQGCRAQGHAVYTGSATQQGRNSPLQAVLQVLRSVLGIEGQDDPATARTLIERRVGSLDPRLGASLPTIFDLAEVPDPDRPAPPLDPEARQRQLVALLRHLIKVDADSAPNVILIEDLHWLDDASASVIEQLVEGREGVRNLLILNYRPEFRAAWMQGSACRQITLQPLADDAIGGLLDDLLGDDPSLGVLAAPIAALTKGNPYFVEEIVQTLAETGRIEGTRGAYRLAGAFGGLEVPPTVKAVVSARIDRLPEATRHVLQFAAVIGMVVPEPLLASASGIPAGELSEALAQLRRNEFIVEQAAFPVSEFAFKHPLTLEVAQSSLIKSTRRDIHAAVARTLEGEGSARAEELAAELAMHWGEAGEHLKAAHCHRRAADRFTRTDFPSAVWHWERARTLAHDRLAGPEDYDLIFAAYIALLNLNFRVGCDLDAAKAVLAEGDALAAAIGQDALRLTLAICFSRVVCAAGDAEEYYRLAKQNQIAAGAPGMEALLPLATVFYLDSLAHTGRTNEGDAQTQIALERWPETFPREQWIAGLNPHAYFLFIGGFFAGWKGRIEESIATLGRAIALAEAERTEEVVGWASFALTFLNFFVGDAAAAAESAARATHVSEKFGSPLLLMYARVSNALALRAAGRPQDAIEPAREACAIAERSERHWEAVPLGQLAWAAFEAGDLDWAEGVAKMTIARATESGARHWTALGQAVQALIQQARGEPAGSGVEDAAQWIEGEGVGLLVPHLAQWRAKVAATA